MKGSNRKERQRQSARKKKSATQQPVSQTQYIHNQTANQLIVKGQGADASDVAMLSREIPGFGDASVRDYHEQIDQRTKDREHNRELQRNRDGHARTVTYLLAGLIAYGLTLLASVSVFGAPDAVWHLSAAIGALAMLVRLLLIKWGTRASGNTPSQPAQSNGHRNKPHQLQGVARKKMLEHGRDEGPESGNESELTPGTAPAPAPADRPDH